MSERAAERRARVLAVPALGAAAGDPRYPEILAEAARVLRSGGLVAFPTETVYGLGALATDPGAVARIFAAKGRPADNPLIVHVADPEQARSLVRAWPDAAERLVRAFWPGPLTLVLPRAAHVPDAVTGGLDTVAVRCPAHPVARELIAAAGPLAAPSANRSGRPSPTTAAHVVEDLGGHVDLILDAGPCPVGVESTVLALDREPPEVLRPGGVTPAQLRAVLGAVVEAAGLSADGRPRSPGVKYPHYAPRAELRVLDAGDPPDAAALAAALARELQAALGEGRRAGAVVPLELMARGWPVPVVPGGPLHRADALAASLYAALRVLDAMGLDVILAYLPPSEGLGGAVRNRLLKAASRVLRAAEG